MRVSLAALISRCSLCVCASGGRVAMCARIVLVFVRSLVARPRAHCDAGLPPPPTPCPSFASSAPTVASGPSGYRVWRQTRLPANYSSVHPLLVVCDMHCSSVQNDVFLGSASYSGMHRARLVQERPGEGKPSCWLGVYASLDACCREEVQQEPTRHGVACSDNAY